MRSNLAILCILLSTASCASGGITPRAREVRALRGEVDRLNQRATALQTQIAGLEGGYQSALEAREQVLRNELMLLQAQIGALVASVDGAGGDASKPSVAAAEGSSASAPDASRAKAPRRKPEPKEAAPEPEAESDDNPSERVRALMADVASRLQVASESKGSDAQSAARLSRARQLLVEADKAASRRDFAQAEKLAQDAAEVIADVVAGGGTAKPQ